MRKLIVFLFMWPTTPYHLRDFRVVGYLQFFFVLGIALVLYLDIYPLNLLLTCLSIVLYADSPKIYIFVENMPQQRGGAFLNSLSVFPDLDASLTDYLIPTLMFDHSMQSKHLKILPSKILC